MKPTTVLALMVGLACATGCKKKDAATAQADDGAAAAGDAGMVGAVAPDSDAGDTTTEVTPPAALVAADPDIPLNEAVVGTTPLPADYSAALAPPAAVVEDRPPQPDPSNAWVPGYWWWSRPLNRYVWISGAWRTAPPDQVWSPGAWRPVGGRYSWTPGYWGPRGFAREEIAVGPPPLRVEERGIAPGEGMTWTPGYYGYRGGSYNWVAGSWVRPPSVGVSWVEPRYVNSGGHYFLQPGRWDLPPERRGTVYRPDIDVRPGAHVKLAVVPVDVVQVHTHFVAESSHAIAQGAVRLPSGGYVEHVRVDERVRAPGVVVHEDVHVEHPGVVVHEEVHANAPGVVVHEEVRGRAPAVVVQTPQVHVNVPPPPHATVQVHVGAPGRDEHHH